MYLMNVINSDRGDGAGATFLWHIFGHQRIALLVQSVHIDMSPFSSVK